MVLEVRIDCDDPPCGSVSRRREDEAADARADVAVAFTGWLGLLAALSALVRPAE